MDIISKLNELQMEGKSPVEILQYIVTTCTYDDKVILQNDYSNGGTNMGDSVLIAVSLL